MKGREFVFCFASSPFPARRTESRLGAKPRSSWLAALSRFFFREPLNSSK